MQNKICDGRFSRKDNLKNNMKKFTFSMLGLMNAKSVEKHLFKQVL